MPQLEALNVLYFAFIFVFLSIILLCFYDNFITHLHYSVINIRLLYAQSINKIGLKKFNNLLIYKAYFVYLFLNSNLKNFSIFSFYFFNKYTSYYWQYLTTLKKKIIC